MKLEKTLSIIKPDAVKKNIMGKIITRFENAGLSVVALRMIHLSKLEADEPGGDDIETPGTDGMEDSEVEDDNEEDAAIDSGQTTEYDELIKKTLGVDQVPQSKNKYKYPGSGGATYMEQVKPDDLEIWQKLWAAKPEKKTEKGVETAGVGKGELSLYWLYNYSNSTVDLAGYYLTDKIFNLTKWKFPDNGSSIPPQSYMIVWCDEDQEQGTLHSNFKLSSSGESIALVMPDGQTILDSVSFPQQNTDISFGRVWQNEWDYLTPSPNDVNASLSSFDDKVSIEVFDIIGMYPNPFNNNLSVLVYLNESVEYLDVNVISLSGQLVKSIKY